MLVTLNETLKLAEGKHMALGGFNITNLESLTLSNTNMILGGAIRDSLEEIYDEIEKGCLRETRFKDAVLCMIDGWDQQKLIQHRYTLREETFSVVCGT